MNPKFVGVQLKDFNCSSSWAEPLDSDILRSKVKTFVFITAGWFSKRPPPLFCFCCFYSLYPPFIASWQGSWTISGSSLAVAAVAVGDDISGSVDWLDQRSFISINRSCTSIIQLSYTSIQYIYRQEKTSSCCCSSALSLPLTGELPPLPHTFHFNCMIDLIFADQLTWNSHQNSFLLHNSSYDVWQLFTAPKSCQ